MNLIIVESPTKAKTFSKYLDSKKYQVIASYGHLRDLPENKLGIDLTDRFKPQYQLSKLKQGYFNQIKASADNADQITLATDSDREGEAIAYHVAYLLAYINEKWPESKL